MSNLEKGQIVRILQRHGQGSSRRALGGQVDQRQQRLDIRSVELEAGPREHLAILEKDPVVDQERYRSVQQQIDDARAPRGRD